VGTLTYSAGRQIFHYQTPYPLEWDTSINGGKPYRTIRWGKHLQIWLMESRDFRSPNTMNSDDPKKTMWGFEQIDWLKRTLAQSDATFRIVINQGPVVGPDRPEEPTEEEKKRIIVNLVRPPRIDNLANSAWHIERSRILNEVLAGHKNLILLVGDRHWKYHSVYPNKRNGTLHELSCGSVSDKHAQSGLRMVGVPTPDQNEMLAWRDEVEQGGFISVEVDPGGEEAQPTTRVRFHKVDGAAAYPVNTDGRREVLFKADGTVIYTR
jgi:phosphodiesterase/alkaline phosphatase D-like protein